MSTKDHIHLYPADDSTPQWQWHVVDYSPTPEFYQTVTITQTGEIVIHTLKNAGVPVINYSLEHVIILRAEYGKTVTERLIDILSMVGKPLKYVGFEHTESPLAPIEYAVIDEGGIGTIKFITPDLSYGYIPIKLKKGSVVL